MAKQLMLEIADVRARALTAFNRNWRSWARSLFIGEEGPVALAVSLHPPRESDLATGEQIARARDWVARWKDCALPGVAWEQRSWARVGDQSIPVRVNLQGAEQIALWAERRQIWDIATLRTNDLLERFAGSWHATNIDYGPEAIAAHDDIFQEHETRQERETQGDDSCGYDDAKHGQQVRGTLPDCASDMRQAAANAVRSSIGDWCALSDEDWNTTLLVWDWLFGHPRELRFVRQLPIRGIDTKWIESHGKALRPLYSALVGHDLSFASPEKQFRCKACSPELQLGGCDEFALSATQLARWDKPPKTVVICENLVNTLCLHELPGVLAVHGSGFAVTELKAVDWLANAAIVYWGDLDSNGFAILNALRAFAPHACSLMMDETTLHRYFDLCVDEPKPVAGTFGNLTPSEHATLLTLAQGDPTRGIANLRLEQERIEWNWAYERISERIIGV